MAIGQGYTNLPRRSGPRTTSPRSYSKQGSEATHNKTVQACNERLSKQTVLHSLFSAKELFGPYELLIVRRIILVVYCFKPLAFNVST